MFHKNESALTAIIQLSKLELSSDYLNNVDGQNSWELGGVKMGVFESYFGKSDKIDGNWV